MCKWDIFSHESHTSASRKLKKCRVMAILGENFSERLKNLMTELGALVIQEGLGRWRRNVRIP